MTVGTQRVAESNTGRHAKPYYGGESLDEEALAAAIATFQSARSHLDLDLGSDLQAQQIVAHALRVYAEALS